MVSSRCILASAIFVTGAATACQDCTNAHDAASGGGVPTPGASSGPGGQTASGAGLGPIFPDPNGFAQALVVDAMHGSAPVNTTQFGHILEDINHACEGGLYANMLRNADMKEGNANPPQSWSLYAVNGGTGNITLDTSNPVDPNQASALHLTIGQNGAGQRVGVSNAGFYGIGLRPSTSYAVSFYARASATLLGPLHVDLEDGNGVIWATAQIAAPGTAWQQFNTTLVTSASTPIASDYVFVISVDGAGGGASLWFNSIECLAPTAPGTNLRADLVASLKATHPGYFRIPGGNYLEGLTVATRFNWKATVGPLVSRPGHQDDAWGYWSTDGMGLLSYLELAEQTGSEPILAVYAGYNLNGSSIPQSALAPYVQDALDEIEYVIGDASTPWGAQRVADGHPAPFTLNYVEIGNEDFFDSTDSYNTYRFPLFYDAIRAAYPNLMLIATRTDVTSRVVDVVDNHTYQNDPKTFVSLQRIYNDTPRRGPRYMEGEYASIDVSDSNPLGTLAGAIGEAAYMTGLENNADVVMGASYAPALANVNSFQWATNLLGFDTLHTYAAPSYYVQQMFGTLKGNYLMPTMPIGLDPNISYVASHAPDGTIYVTVVNPLSSAASMQIIVSGSTGVAASGTLTVLTGDPAARNSAANPNAVPPPQVSAFMASPSFSQTFPPNSVSVLQMRTTGAFVPYLQVDRGYSLGSKSPAYRRETIASEQDSVAMSEVSPSSAGGDKKAATFVLRAGLADPHCYSFEMRSTPGSFMLQQNYQLITAPTQAAPTQRPPTRLSVPSLTATTHRAYHGNRSATQGAFCGPTTARFGSPNMAARCLATHPTVGTVISFGRPSTPVGGKATST